MENNEVKSQIGILQTTDLDTQLDNKVRHRIEGINATSPADAQSIRIDPFTGQIYANVSFDRESKSSYSFRAIAFDPDSPNLTSSAQLEIHILYYLKEIIGISLCHN